MATAKAIRLKRNDDGSVTASYADSSSSAKRVVIKNSGSSGSSGTSKSSGSSSGVRTVQRNGYTITASPTRTGYDSPRYDHEEPYEDAYGNIKYYPADKYGNSTGDWHSNLVVPDYSKKSPNQSYADYFADLNFGYNQEYEDDYVYYRPASKVPTITIRKNGSSSSSSSGSSRDSESSSYGGGVAALRAARQAASSGSSWEPSYSGGSSPSGNYLNSQNALIEAQLEALLSQINSTKTAVSQQADDAARQAYINLKSSENTLPQSLSAAGQSGGLAQSAMLNLYTNYERSRNDIQRDRMNQLAEIENTMSQAKADGNIQKAQAALDYQKQQAEQEYQKELLRLKAEQQQALSRQQHLQEMQQISAKNNSQRALSLESEVEEELILSEAYESLVSSGDISSWRREYAGILNDSQLNQILRQFQG